MIKNNSLIYLATACCIAFAACKRTYTCTAKTESTTVIAKEILTDYILVPPKVLMNSNVTGATFYLADYNNRADYNAAIAAEQQRMISAAEATVTGKTETISVTFNNAIVSPSNDVKSNVNSTDKTTYENKGYACTSN